MQLLYNLYIHNAMGLQFFATWVSLFFGSKTADTVISHIGSSPSPLNVFSNKYVTVGL